MSPTFLPKPAGGMDLSHDIGKETNMLNKPEIGPEKVNLGFTANRYSRRLSDKIFIAFHHACDQADYDIAGQLLDVVETLLTRKNVPVDVNRRKSIENLVASHERLWQLRHPEELFE